MNNLLLEIGTEEIPAGYIEASLAALSSLLKDGLGEARVKHDSIRTFGTPRRLAAMIENVADKQESVATDVVGPPERIGFDERGRATVAAEKFAAKVGVSVRKLGRTTTEKGTYLCATTTKRGLSTRKVLKQVLPDVIRAIPFPKTMRWSDLEVSFARPIQSILALLGPDVIPFDLGGIKSGRYTFGHRFMHPDRIRISTADDYVASLNAGYVLADISERKRKIEEDVGKAAAELGASALADDELTNTVTNLVEYPVVAVGKIDSAYLGLPREILIMAMREHQKYFAVVNEEDHLEPYFIAVTNTRARDMEAVAKGHERVLRARLDDAQFFYRSDLEKPLEALTYQLQGVLFQAELGSMYEKVERIGKLSAFLVDATAQSAQNRTRSEAKRGAQDMGAELSVLREQVSRAAQLCKADLVTEVVTEFPKLQGTMGRVYASKAGEADVVAQAIEEHYRPAYSGGPLPSSDAGAILATADKLDSICGCFKVGIVPTGTSDPYALRRQGIGVIQIMLQRNFTFSLGETVEKSLELYPVEGEAETADRVCGFLESRMAHLLVEEGFSRDVVNAVIASSSDNIPNVWKRVRALEQLKAKPGFEHLAVSFKRVVNILKQAGDLEAAPADVTVDLLQHESELNLHDAYRRVSQSVSEKLNAGRFDEALLEVAGIRGAVDRFFDDVMVMTDEEDLRTNRLLMLKQIADLFRAFADFSQIST